MMVFAIIHQYQILYVLQYISDDIINPSEVGLELDNNVSSEHARPRNKQVSTRFINRG